MKKIKSKMPKAIFLIAFFVFANTANAQIPVTDAASLIQLVNDSMAKLKQWAKEKVMHRAEMEMHGANSQLQIDALNNAMANVIARNGKTIQDIQNLELIEQSVPDKDSCGNAAASKLEEEADCASSVIVTKESKKSITKHSKYMATPAQQDEALKTIVKEKVETCNSLTDPTTASADSKLASTLCTRGDLLLGVSTGDTFTNTESEAVDEYIDLIVGTIPRKKTAGNYKGADASQNQVLVNDMRIEAYRSLVNNSLLAVAAARKSGNEATPSSLHALQSFDDEHYGDAEWLATVGNVDKNKKNSVYGSEITRKMAAMDAFLVHMTMITYKQRLRMEALQAATLAIQIDPPKN